MTLTVGMSVEDSKSVQIYVSPSLSAKGYVGAVYVRTQGSVIPNGAIFVANLYIREDGKKRLVTAPKVIAGLEAEAKSTFKMFNNLVKEVSDALGDPARMEILVRRRTLEFDAETA